MKLIDRYIAKQLIGTFIFSAAAFTLITTGAMFARSSETISKYGATAYQTMLYLSCQLPQAIVPVLPMSMLLASLITFGKLSSTSEIIAMKAGGISFGRVLLPVVAIGFIVSLVSFAIAQFIVPATNNQTKAVSDWIKKIDSSRQTQYIQNVLIKGADDRSEKYYLMYAKQLDKQTKQLDNPTIQVFSNNRLTQVITAKSSSFSDNSWQVSDCQVFTLGSTETFGTAPAMTVPIHKTPEVVLAELSDPATLNLTDLFSAYASLRADGTIEIYRKFETELFQRSAIPFAGLIFAIIGTPLGMQSNRSSSSVGLGISLVVILVYYSIYSFTVTLGQSGVISGFIAAWSANILFLVIGLSLCFRTHKK